MSFDIIVSELLGSFADNELAPECLAATVKMARPSCVYIPQSHTSFLYPVAAPILRRLLQDEGTPTQTHCPWVLSARAVPIADQGLSKHVVYKLLSSSVGAPVFSFSYAPTGITASPATEATATVEFDPSNNAVDGFCGMFQAVLIDDICLSTLPGHVTPGLNEWNPMFFPVGASEVSSENPIRAQMRRVTLPAAAANQTTTVHYEWRLGEQAWRNAGGHAWVMGRASATSKE